LRPRILQFAFRNLIPTELSTSFPTRTRRAPA